MGRDINIDFGKGGGSDLEVVRGKVTIRSTDVHEVGSRIILPAPTPVALADGTAVLPNVAVSPDGPEPAWAYEVVVRDEVSGYARAWLVGVPEGEGPIDFNLLPRFTTAGPPGTTGAQVQAWADAAQDGATRAEAAALAAEAPTDTMNKTLIEDPESETHGALIAAIEQRIFVSETAPADPTAGMVWFDTSVPFVPDAPNAIDSLSGLLVRYRVNDVDAAAGTAVATIEPRSGSQSVALAQATAANRPTLLHSAVGGKRALQFTPAESDFMSMSLPLMSTPVTVFAVFDIDNAASYVLGGQNSGQHAGILTNVGGTTIRMNTSASLGAGVTSTWTAGDGFRIVAAVYEAGTNAARFYDTKLTATTGTTSTAAVANLGPIFVGRAPADYGGGYANLKLADLAIVSGAVSDADVKTVLQDLGTYYGVTLGA